MQARISGQPLLKGTSAGWGAAISVLARTWASAPSQSPWCVFGPKSLKWWLVKSTNRSLYLVCAPLAWFPTGVWCCLLWRWSVYKGSGSPLAQVALIVTFSSSSHPHRRPWKPWAFNQALVLCGQGPNPAEKWNQHLYKAALQKEAWRALKISCWILCWPFHQIKQEHQHHRAPRSITLPPDYWDLDFQIKYNIYFFFLRKRPFAPWATVQDFLSSAKVGHLCCLHLTPGML